jgi:hypothetical protein
MERLAVLLRNVPLRAEGHQSEPGFLMPRITIPLCFRLHKRRPAVRFVASMMESAITEVILTPESGVFLPQFDSWELVAPTTRPSL